jgi:predicted RNA-binding protein with RPS1 domain
VHPERRRRGAGGAGNRRGRLRRDQAVAREGQARRGLERTRGSLRRRGSGQGHDQRQGQGRLHRRRQHDPRVPARLPGRCAPGARHRAPRRQGARVQGHQARPEAQQRGRVAPRGRWKRNSAEREQLLENLQEGQGSRAWSRTSPTTVPSSTSAASTACCTSPTWPGSASSIRPRSSKSARRSTSRCSSSTASASASPWVSSSWATIPGSTSPAATPRAAASSAKVTNITDYGCFVEIEEGVEGLVHVSEMDWTNKNVHPSKVVQLGDEVEVMVLDIDEERRRISLGIKQCQQNPWDEPSRPSKQGRPHQRRHQVDHRLRHLHRPRRQHRRPGAPVRHQLERDRRRGGARYKKGDEIETVILSIDPERERISLGIKQLEDDPFGNYIAVNDRGSIVTGEVVAVDAKAVTVKLADEVEGYPQGLRHLPRACRRRAQRVQGR